MNTNSKLTEEQINAGWIEIESEEQVKRLTIVQADFLKADDTKSTLLRSSKIATVWYGAATAYSLEAVASDFIAYRPLPSGDEYAKLENEVSRLQGSLGLAASVNQQLFEKMTANNGKTLRDEIAIAVLSALIQSLVVGGNNHEHYKKRLPDTAYEYADAMLKSRGAE